VKIFKPPKRGERFGSKGDTSLLDPELYFDESASLSLLLRFIYRCLTGSFEISVDGSTAVVGSSKIC